MHNRFSGVTELAFLTGGMRDIRFLAIEIRDSKGSGNGISKDTTAGYGICLKTDAGWRDGGMKVPCCAPSSFVTNVDFRMIRSVPKASFSSSYSPHYHVSFLLQSHVQTEN